MSAVKSNDSTITIAGMRFWGKHGAQADERTRDQPIDVDVELACDLHTAAASDDLSDTVDYAAVYQTCQKIVTQESYALLEALAGRIAGAILNDVRVSGVTVRVRKPRLLDGATPEIRLQVRRTEP